MFALSRGTKREPPGEGTVFAVGGPCWSGLTTRGEGTENGDAGGSEVPAHALRVACQEGKRRRLIKWARVVSIISIVMSVLFGAAAMFCGLVGDLIISLVAIALETWIDMLSSIAVLWRFERDDASFIRRSPFSPPTPFRPGSAPLSKGCSGSLSLPNGGGTPPKKQTSGRQVAGEDSRGTFSPSGGHTVEGKTETSSPCSPKATPVPRTNAGDYSLAEVDFSAATVAQRPAGVTSRAEVSLASSSPLSTPSFLARPVLSGKKQDKEGGAVPRPLIERSSGDLLMGSDSRGDSIAIPLNHSLSFTAREKYSSMFVGFLFILLAVWVGGQASYTLLVNNKGSAASIGLNEQFAQRQSMFRVALYTCLICWPSAVVFGVLAVVKFNLAARLRSEVMGKDAMCSAFGVALSLVAGIVGFVGLGDVGLGRAAREGTSNAPANRVNTAVYDASAAILIGVLMLVEGIRTVHENSRRRTVHVAQGARELVVVPGTSAYNHHVYTV
ncbi:transmembrane protein [Cystoisospora suis]|uniref:Transmembrane protein n=1 Tax=Cystoisospora suis TaxID=483139 RepID=A0A2C6LCB1_9APIC|nr:transmembrane protein [Cystoisospora suis]